MLRPPLSLLLLLLSGWVLSSCSQFSTKTAPPERRDYLVTPAPLVVGKGDILRVASFDKRLPTGVFVVSKEGEILFPYVGKVKVGGLQLAQVHALLVRRLQDGYFRSPKLTVTFQAQSSQKITVLGSVGKSQTIPYTPRLTILEALSLAGGLKKNADSDAVTVMRKYKGRDYRIKVAIRQIIEGKIPNFYLLPGDIVIVPEKFI